VFGLYSVDWWYDLKGSWIAWKTIWKNGVDYKISMKDMDFVEQKEIIDLEREEDVQELV